MKPGAYVFNVEDPRAPSEEQWAGLGVEERARIVAQLPSEPRRESKEEALAATLEQERRRADTAEARAETAEALAARLAARLRELGIDPDD